MAPVIVTGIVVVILVLVIKKKRKSNDKAETYMAEGIDLGLCLGARNGSSILGFFSYFISFGTLIGLLVGMQIKK